MTETLESTAGEDAEGAYIRSNGDFFVSTFSRLLSMYEGAMTLNILSEEEMATFSVGLMKTDESAGVMDVSCVKFEPNQASPRTCFNNIV